jgi:hypothetical protein
MWFHVVFACAPGSGSAVALAVELCDPIRLCGWRVAPNLRHIVLTCIYDQHVFRVSELRFTNRSPWVHLQPLPGEYDAVNKRTRSFAGHLYNQLVTRAPRIAMRLLLVGR